MKYILPSGEKLKFLSLYAFLKQNELETEITHVQYYQGSYYPILEGPQLFMVNLMHNNKDVQDFQNQYLHTLRQCVKDCTLTDADLQTIREAEALIKQQIILEVGQ